MNIMKNFLRRVYNSLSKPAREQLLVSLNEQILRGTSRLVNTAILHQKTFAEYKGCNVGKEVVIVGAGPTVNKFQPIENCIYIGLNRACVLSNVKFDYLFTIDKLGIEQYYKEFGEYDCVKFVGDQNLGLHWQIPETEILKMKNVRQYKTDAGLYSRSFFTLDIDKEPLGNFNTVSLQAMQFALYTQPKRIYLVGIDCSTAGHFNKDQSNETTIDKLLVARGSDKKRLADDSIRFWIEMKDFAREYFPDVEIISVNPVGLKGVFTDLYQ